MGNQHANVLQIHKFTVNTDKTTRQKNALNILTKTVLPEDTLVEVVVG